MKVEDMPAGLKMDALVAEHVMGWEVFNQDNLLSRPHYRVEVGGILARPVPQFSENIAAAWQVDKPEWRWEFAEFDLVLMAMLNIPTGDGDYEYLDLRVEWRSAPDKQSTYCLARCRLALLACGVTEIEDD